MTTARQIVQLALEGMNRLSPGEVIDADLAAIALRQLNAIADQMSAGRADLFKDLLVSGPATGAALTIGTGAFLSVSPGQEIQGMTADGYRMTSITFEQYRDIKDKSVAGRPINYAYDGAETIYLYPQATGNTMAVQSRADLQQFADLDTSYTLPSGYLMAFSTSLQVSLAPTLLGGVPASIERANMKAMMGIEGANIRPLMLGGDPINRARPTGGILNGFN